MSNIDIKIIFTVFFGNFSKFFEFFIQFKNAYVIEECSKSKKKLYHFFKEKSLKYSNMLLQVTFG